MCHCDWGRVSWTGHVSLTNPYQTKLYNRIVWTWIEYMGNERGISWYEWPDMRIKLPQKPSLERYRFVTSQVPLHRNPMGQKQWSELANYILPIYLYAIWYKTWHRLQKNENHERRGVYQTCFLSFRLKVYKFDMTLVRIDLRDTDEVL